MTTKLSGFQHYIGTWGQNTFPDATINGQLAHLDLELNEVHEAANVFFNNPSIENKKAVQEEIADVFILLLGVAHKMDFDLMLVAAGKFRVLQSRKWLPANPDGVYHHIAEDIVA